jgi:hypothetical protein
MCGEKLGVAAVIVGLLVACGQGREGREGREGRDSIDDLGDGPDDASSGTVWECSFYAYGLDGSSWVEVDETDEICFASLDDANDYVEQWRDDCVDLFVDEGYSDYVCNAACGDTEEEC